MTEEMGRIRVPHKFVRRKTPISMAPLLISSLVFAMFLFAGSHYLSAIGCGFTVAAIYFCLLTNGRVFPIRWFITAVAGLQWLLVPTLAYLKFGAYEPSPMRVAEQEYMLLAVPGTFALSLGLALFDRVDRNYQLKALTEVRVRWTGYKALLFPFLVVSLFGSFGAYLVPGELGFLLYLMSNLKYVAVLLLVASGSRWSKHAIIIILFVGTLDAAAGGLFHDVFLWATILTTFYWYMNLVDKTTRLVIVGLAIVTVGSFQTVKGEYRTDLASRAASGEISEYADRTLTRLGDIIIGEYDFNAVYVSTLERLNQGAIVSSVIDWTSRTQAYANGDTIQEGLVAAFVPRLLVPSKATAGGQKTFQRFTGRKLSKNTSMGVGLLGEAYGNFGTAGGVTFMLGFGLGIALLLRVTENIFWSKPLGLVMLPLIYLHAIKAETDFVTTTNHVVKATLFCIALVFLLERRFLGKAPMQRYRQGLPST